MDVNDTALLDATELLAAYAAGSFSPLQALQGVTERIARRNPEINAFAAMNPSALAAARESTLRWRDGQARALEGVPVTVCDFMDVAGLPTRRGSKTTDSGPVRRDSPMISVLRAAGAVLIGKTNVSEFGWAYLGDSPLHGIIRNPWDTLYTAGGPAGGAAAAAAGFFGPLHIADGAVCVPAAWTGVVGLKVGTISENQGIMARSVADAALLSRLLRGQSLGEPMDAGLQGLKIGVLRAPGFAAPADFTAWETVAAACDSLMKQGAELSEIDVDLKEIDKSFASIWSLNCAKAVDALSPSQYSLLSPGLRALAARPLGTEQKGEASRAEAKAWAAALNVDAILCPAVPHSAPLAGELVSDPQAALVKDWAPWTMLFSLADQPALTLPMGVGKNGLPTSVQIAAKPDCEDMLLNIAAALEHSLG